MAIEVPVLHLDEFEVAAEAIETVPRDVAIEHHLMPVHKLGVAKCLVVAMARPEDTLAIEIVEALTGYHVEVVFTDDDQIERAIQRYYPTFH